MAIAGRIRVDDPSDPRLADYVALNDPDRRREIERRGDYFIVEGVVAIERLLDRSDWTPRSLLLTDSVAERLSDQLHGLAAPVFLAAPEVLESVVGFDLHRGALASVDRPAALDATQLIRDARLLLLADGLNDHENLGALFRNAAAFGVAGVLLGPTTADPLYRRSVRVSMGHVLDVPFASIGALPESLAMVRSAGATVLASTPAAEATDLRLVDPARLRSPLVVAVGAEGAGLSAATLAGADLACRIPMAPGVDSLNVATAAAVALFHLGRFPRSGHPPGRRGP